MVDVTYQMLLSTIQTIALIVGIIYYLTIMRNNQKNQQIQLETRQAQMFMQIYNQAQSLELKKARRIFSNLKLSNFEELIQVINPEIPENLDNYEALSTLVSHYEGVGALVREGLLDIRWVALLYAGATRRLWEKIAQYAEGMRKLTEQPRWASEWEYLYDELMKYMKEHPELAT
jgi:hypothetical protein